MYSHSLCDENNLVHVTVFIFSYSFETRVTEIRAYLCLKGFNLNDWLKLGLVPGSLY